MGDIHQLFCLIECCSIVFRVPRSGFQYSAVEKGRCAHFGFFIFRFPFDMCSVVKETAPKEHTSGVLSAFSA